MRKILLICPEFHGTEKKINSTIEENGYSCSTIFYDEKKYRKNKLLLIPLSALKLASEFLDTKYLKRKYWEYWYLLTFDQIAFENLVTIKLGDLNSDYDDILIIKGLGLSPTLVSQMKNKFHRARFIIYQWDSIDRIPSVEGIYPYFDKIFSFEYNAKLSNPKIEYLPMFTPNINTFKTNTIKNNKPEEIDFLFVGKFTFYRLAKLSLLASWCLINNKSYFFRLVHGINSIKKLGWLISTNISHEKYQHLMMKSKIIVEICHKEQKGYTQRIGESLSENKIVITNNEDAINAFKDCGVYPINLKYLNKYLNHNIDSNRSKINSLLLSPTSWLSRIMS